MVRAIWNDVVVAESDETVLVEGHHYFPLDSVAQEHLRSSELITRCFWKGTANYYDVVVDDAVAKDGAWTYRAPSEAAGNIRDYIAFWHGVRVVADGG
ncbi:MAG: DUF427 domain-containing protein [Myxococcota bacterium]